MFPKFNLVYIILFVNILKLPSALSYEDEEHEDLFDIDVISWCIPGNKASSLCSLNVSVLAPVIPFEPNPKFPSPLYVQRFYYDITMQGCKSSTYGGCNLAFNGFTTLKECGDLCDAVGSGVLSPEKLESLTPEVICRLQKDFGACFEYQPSYYYDVSTRTCKGFSYSGCGGNGNRFSSNHRCMEACESIMPKYKIVRPRKRK